jgi:integrase
MAKRMRGLYKRGNVWWCSYLSASGRMVRESTTQTDYNKAVEFLVKRRTEVAAGKAPEESKIIAGRTFGELAEHYLTWCERQKGYIAKERVVNQLIARFGDVPLRRFSTMLLEQYQTERMRQGAKHKAMRKGPDGKRVAVEVETAPKGNKPATINRHMAAIKHMFTKAVEWDMVEEDVLKRVRKVKQLKENNRRLRYLSKEECQALVDACEGYLKSIVITALNTGMRRGELLSLKWDNLDLKHGFILLEQEDTKNGERREIPINETLRRTLEALPRRLDGGNVFFNPETDKPYQTLSAAFIKACEKAGIQDFRFHDLRHTFASILVMAGKDLTTVKELLGHKTLAMTLRYAHLAPSHKVQAVDALDGIFNQTSTSHLLHNQGVK